MEIRGGDLRFSLGGDPRGCSRRPASRSRTPPSPDCTSAPRGGPRACGSRRSRSRASGPRALRRRVLGQRAHRGGLPAGGGARAPAGGGARPAAAHVDPGPRERAAGRLPERRLGLGARSCSSSRTRTRSCRRSTPAGRGSAITICSPTSCGSSCGGSRRRPSGRSTARPPSGTRRTATWSRRSATRRRRATGRNASRMLADNYLSLVFDGRLATLRGLLAAFPQDAADTDPELALAFAKARLSDGLLNESAHFLAAAQRRSDAVPAERRPRFDLQLAETQLALARRRGDLPSVLERMRSVEAAVAAQPASVRGLGTAIALRPGGDITPAEREISSSSESPPTSTRATGARRRAPEAADRQGPQARHQAACVGRRLARAVTNGAAQRRASGGPRARGRTGRAGSEARAPPARSAASRRSRRASRARGP